ncbi:MAG: ABC transporter permease [Betaproteobacteria bacterium]|jgi:peptide/nickel transport system permease protein|nr:ABC transporter permease [Betaproteobacteria bacterium]
MLRFVFSRLAAVVPVLFVVSCVVFLILRLAPGDPAAVIAGSSATNADIEQIRARLGLDRSLPVQFGIWLGRVLQGDLGYSYFLNKPVTELIAQRLEPTASLAIGTILLAVLIAVPLGAIAAARMGGWVDRALSVLSVAGFSIPVFVTGYVLIYLFSIQLDWLPVQGYRPLGGKEGLAGWARHLILPWAALSIIYVALIARITRAAVSEALTEDYIRTARAKGVSEQVVLIRHALRNAAVPIVTVIGIGVALLIGGVVVTETVFAIPGLGSLTVDVVLNRDFPVIQGLVMFFAVSYVLINLLVDLSYLALDPRIRY